MSVTLGASARARRALALVTALVLLVLGVGPAPAGARQTDPTDTSTTEPTSSPTSSPTSPTSPTTSPAAPATIGPTGSPALELLDQDPWIGPRGTFHVKLRIVTPADGYTIEARVFRPVDDAAAVLDTTNDEPSTRSLGRFVRRSLSAGTVTEELEAMVVPDADGTPGDPFVLDPGVYPVQVVLLDPDDEQVDTLVTYLVHLSDALLADPVPIGLIADLRVDPSRAADGRARPDAASIELLQRQLDALQTYGGVPLSVQLHPETVSALSGNRAGAGGSALASLERFAGQGAVGGAEIVSGTFVGFDEGAWVADGHTDVLRAELDAGRATVAGADLRAAAAATLHGRASEAVLRLLDSFDVDHVIEAQPLPTSGDLGVSFGGAPRPVRQRPSQLVLPAAAGSLTAVASGQQPSAADAYRLLASLLVAPLNGDQRAQHLRLDGRSGGVAFDGDFATTILTELAAPGPLEAASVTDLFRDTEHHDAPFEALSGVSTTGGSGTRGVQLADISRRVAGLRGLLGSDDVTAGLEARLLLVPATGIDDADASALVAGVDESIAAVTRSVIIPQAQAFTVTSHRSQLPFVLRNETDRPLQILLTLDSSEVEFVGANPRPVTLQPGPNDLEIDIQTRRSGEFDFDVAVTSPDGGLVLGAIRVKVLSRAISGVGVFLSGGALVFLFVWWVRNARRRRRIRRDTPTQQPAVASSDAVAEADREPEGEPDTDASIAVIDAVDDRLGSS